MRAPAALPNASLVSRFAARVAALQRRRGLNTRVQRDVHTFLVLSRQRRLPPSPPPPAPLPSHSYARLSYENDWAISMFTVIPLSYNRVDHEYQGKDWKTEEEFKEEVELMPIDPMPPGWGAQQAAKPDDADDMA